MHTLRAASDFHESLGEESLTATISLFCGLAIYCMGFGVWCLELNVRCAAFGIPASQRNTRYRIPSDLGFFFSFLFFSIEKYAQLCFYFSKKGYNDS